MKDRSEITYLYDVIIIILFQVEQQFLLHFEAMQGKIDAQNLEILDKQKENQAKDLEIGIISNKLKSVESDLVLMGERLALEKSRNAEDDQDLVVVEKQHHLKMPNSGAKSLQ